MLNSITFISILRRKRVSYIIQTFPSHMCSPQVVGVAPVNEEFWILTKTISRSPIQYNTLPISFIPRRTSALSSDFVPQLSCSLTSLIHPAYREISIQVEAKIQIPPTPFFPPKNKKDKRKRVTKDNDHVFINSIPNKSHN